MYDVVVKNQSLFDHMVTNSVSHEILFDKIVMIVFDDHQSTSFKALTFSPTWWFDFDPYL